MVDQERVRLSVTIPADLHAELQRWADRHERSLSREIIYALRFGVGMMTAREFAGDLLGEKLAEVDAWHVERTGR